MTTNPRKRINTHIDDAAVHGVLITKVWLSPETLHRRELEQDLIRFGRANSEETHRNEYFKGLNFDRVCVFADGLPYVIPEQESSQVDTAGTGSSGIFSLDRLRREDDEGTAYWMARDLSRDLGYSRWADFHILTKRAISTLEDASGFDFAAHHIKEVTVSTRIGPSKINAMRSVVDFRLTELAVYIVLMSCYSMKREVATVHMMLAKALIGCSIVDS